MTNKSVEIVTILLALVVLVLLFAFLKNPTALLINAIVGIILLFLLNAILKLGIPIGIITVVVVAIGGILGVVLVVILNRLKIAFC